MEEKVMLTCLNPKGEFEIPAPSGLSNPRIEDLSDKTIAIIWDGKKGGDNYCIAVEELLNRKYPSAKTIRLVWGDAEAAENAKKEMDTFIYGVGDNGMGGWIQCLQVIALERLGKPGVFVIGDNAIHTSKMSAEDAGLPAVRIVSLPSIDYYPNRSTVDSIRPVAEASIDAIIDALTRPLSDEEKNPGLNTGEKPAESVTVTGENYESVIESFNQLYMDNHWGDGLPLIPPTGIAVQHMLTGTNRSPDEVIGKIPYRNGIATVKNIAVNAVMAGARPEYLPVIISAVECLAEEHTYTHMMSSEGSFGLMIMVSGPLGKELNMNHGVGLLGHGWRANNTIGRAVRLCMINLGYLWPGEIDMALIGRQSAHTFYTFAENIDESPWETFNEGLGYSPKDSCVTVDTVMGGMTRIFGGGVVEPWDTKVVLNDIVNDIARDRGVLGAYKVGVANPAAHLRKHILVVHPEFAIMLKRIGYTSKASLRDYLYETTKVPYEDLTIREIQGIHDRINTTPPDIDIFFPHDAMPENRVPVILESLKPGGMVPVVNPEDIHIVVSGSIPGYTFGMSYFRTAHMTKLIHGATLTTSGR
ncbi:MAG: hypothetical protein JW712_12355 [Dehalococcoidales bacterium]|nr:hypothetical protein [Dehalococcoidales bacterium]